MGKYILVFLGSLAILAVGNIGYKEYKFNSYLHTHKCQLVRDYGKTVTAYGPDNAQAKFQRAYVCPDSELIILD